MSRHGKVQDPAAVVRQHQKHVRHLETNGMHGKEVDRHHGLDVIVWEGPSSLRWRTMYLLTLDLPTAMPSLSSSP
jgi:hypothetical protein